MKVWLAEKRDAALKIAQAIGGGKPDGQSIVFPNGDRMLWASGHLLELVEPHDYNPDWKKWDIKTLPMIPARIKRRPRDAQAADRLRSMKAHLSKAKAVVIATDPGREGEGIARQILDHAGYKGPIERLWTQSLAHDHLVKAVKKLQPGSTTLGLGIASSLRQSMDWIEGINHSRLYGIRYGQMGEPISTGRVQSATLAMIVARDLEIEKFVPKAFYELKSDLDLPEGQLTLKHAPAEAKRIDDRSEAEKRKKASEGKSAPLTVKRTPKTLRPPNPFSLPDLQIAASGKWGWTAAKTLQVLQGLYEAGRVTYPRTDSAHLTDDLVNEVPSLMRHLAKNDAYRKIVPAKPVIRKSVFDSSKTTDHHAIIPTDQPGSPARGDADTEKLYDLIARRFLAALMEDAKGESTVISGNFGGVEYRATGLAIVTPGWKAAYDHDDKNQEEKLPRIADGKVVTLDRVDIVSKETKPPPHYTDGTLVKAMVSVGADNPDAEIRDLMSTGIGTQATRHTIIEVLKNRKFVVSQGKKILSTHRGRELVGHMQREANALADPLMTAELERVLKEVEDNPVNAKRVWTDFVTRVASDFNRLTRLKWGNKLRRIDDDTIYKSNAPRGGGTGTKEASKSTRGKTGSGKGSRGSYAKTRKSPAKSPRKPRKRAS